MQKENVIIKNKVILNLTQDLRRLLGSFRNSVRGRFQIKFGMTPLFNKGAFTLIELLVVVLIIGILAAVALPQYQLAIEKSRAMQAFTQGKYLQQLEELYYLEHGAYTNNFKELGADIPQGFSLTGSGTVLFNRDMNFTLLETYDRVLLRNFRPQYALSFNLHTNNFMCTAYSDDNYKAKALCQSLSGQHTDGRRDCNGVCASWLF